MRSKGAVAIADAVKEGLHKLKVLSACWSALWKNAKFLISLFSVHSPTAADYFKIGFSAMQALCSQLKPTGCAIGQWHPTIQ